MHPTVQQTQGVGVALSAAPHCFVHEDFASGDLYQIGNSNPGFRYYPLVKSPNRMEVSVQGLGLTTSKTTGFSCAMICDVLHDDSLCFETFGRGGARALP